MSTTTNSKTTGSVPTLPGEKDILGCVEGFLGPKCLVAVQSIPLKHHYEENPFETKSEFLDRQPKRPRLVRIHIKPQLASISEANNISIQEVVQVEEPFEVEESGSRVATVLAAHDNGRIAVVEKTKDDSVRLRYVGLRGGANTPDEKEPVVLPEEAHSLHVLDTSVFVGFSSSVGWVDFSEEKPEYKELCRRDFGPNSYKKYDMFARSGNLVIAVDDIMCPYYADTIRIGDDGTPKHEEAWNLPGVVNGHYILAGTTGDNILLASTFHHRGGSGSTLLRKPFAEFGSRLGGLGGGTCWNERASYYCPEARAWKTEQATSWRGLAVSKDTRGNDKNIMLAVGKRGVLVLPVDFDDKTVPSFVSFEGEACAVRSVMDETWVLVAAGKEKTKIFNMDTAEEVILPGHYDDLL